jgi:hypothetical protein
MRLTRISLSEARRRLDEPPENEGDAGPSAALMAEVLRGEALAARLVTRTVLLERARRRLLLGDSAAPRLAETLDALLALGDLTGGPRGQLAPAPVRLIELPDGALVLLGAAAMPAVGARSGPMESGLPRRWVAGAEPDGLGAWLDEQEGLRLSAERWSGLSDAPPWREWLEEIESRRAAIEDSAADSMRWSEGEMFHPDPRRAARPRRWREGSLPRASTLMRTRLEQGWSYGLAWSEGGRTRGFSLSRDEARRTYCALAAAAGCPLTFRSQTEAGEVTIAIEPWLPRPEHRIVRISGSLLPGGYRLPLPRWEALRPMIEASTGIVEEGN